MNVLVLMSTYNGEKYIEAQIESIFKQSEINTILLIRDDGSTDNTIKIIEKLKKNYNISIIQGENIGCSRSYFKLITEAINYEDKIDYYAFSDQDDIWEKNKLNAAINILKKNNNKLKLYFSAYNVADREAKILYKKEIKYNNNIGEALVSLYLKEL